MAELVVVYWRDIPAQVLVGRGRRAVKMPLPERFAEAIDRAAMRSGARDTDAYLAEWRKVSRGDVEGDPHEVAKAEAERLEREYDLPRLKQLIEAGGREG